METTNNQSQKTVFDERAAYMLLLQMINYALESENYRALESVITAWEQLYDLTNPDTLEKIKAIQKKIKAYITQYIDRSLANMIFKQQTEQQNIQQEAYNSFKDIIDNANKTKDYATAEREFSKLKRKLRSQNIFISSFDPHFRKKIYKLLLIPPIALKKQEKSMLELKELISSQDSMTSAEYSNRLILWQNTYCLQDFPKDLQKSLNQLILEVSDGISKKTQAESAILDLKDLMYSKKPVSEPLHAVASILAKYDNYNKFDVSSQKTIEQLIEQYLGIQYLPDDNLSQKYNNQPVSQLKLIDELHYILNVSPDDKTAIVSWIHRTRDINFSQFARDEMIKCFTKAGYKIPIQESYSIPTPNLSLNDVQSGKIDSFFQSVIINYLGIMSQGKTLSSSGKQNITDINSTASNPIINKDTEPLLSIPVQDNFSPILLEIADLLENPDITYSFSKRENIKTSNTVAISENDAISATSSEGTSSINNSYTISTSDNSHPEETVNTVITSSLSEQLVYEDSITSNVEVIKDNNILTTSSENDSTMSISDNNPTDEVVDAIIVSSLSAQPVLDAPISSNTVEIIENNNISTTSSENDSSNISTKRTLNTCECTINEDFLSTGTNYALPASEKAIIESTDKKLNSTKTDDSMTVKTSMQNNTNINIKDISNERSTPTFAFFESVIDNSNAYSAISTDYQNLEKTYNFLSLITTLSILKSSKESPSTKSSTLKLRT